MPHDPNRRAPVEAPAPGLPTRCAVSVGLVTAATLARLAINPVLGFQTPFAPYFIAVVVATWFGGVWQGVASTVLSLMAAQFFFVDPRFSLTVASRADVMGMLMFLATAGGLVWITGRWRAAEQRLRRTSEAQRQRSEQLEFQGTLIEQAHDAIFVRDDRQRITFWNRGAAELYGWTADEALGRNAHRLLHTAPEVEQVMTAELATSGAWSGRIQHRRKDGDIVVSDSRQALIRPGVTFEVNRDVTEQVRIERALRDSQQLLRSMMDNFPTVIAFKDRDGRFIDVNPVVEHTLGRPKQEIIGRSLRDFIPGEAADILERHDAEVMASRTAVQRQEETPLPSGTVYHLDTAFPLIDADGRVYGTGHISHDITALRIAQDELHANERRLAAIMDATTESIWLLDRDRILAANATAAARLGRMVDQLVGTDWKTIMPADTVAIRSAKLEEVFAKRQPVRFEDERDGIRFDHTFYPVFDETGSITAVAAFSRDVTELRRADREVREMAQRLAYHVNHSPLAVIEFGPDMRLTRWTGAAERLFGWRSDEVLGKRMDEFRWVYEDDGPLVDDVSSSLQTGADPRRFSANRNYRKDGQVVFCEWYNSSLLDESGQMRSILSLVLDVTEKKRLEDELRAQTEQLAAANRLKDDFLATLSHELRTPINAILGWAQILSMTTPTEERLHRGIETITRNARLQAQMVEDLLDVSRIVTGSVRLDIQPVDVKAVAEQALDGVRPGADARHITLSVDVQPGLILPADSVRLQQVLWNLLSNAVKFTPPGGAVSLTARAADDQAEIAVRDTGIGIAAEFLPHAFERFTQADSSPTREHGGLGIGLAIVRHIVELHGGTVAAQSPGPGRGAVFTIRLPLQAGAIGHPGGSADRAARTGDPGRLLEGIRVLIVDDQADAREMVATMLTAAGAIVASAPSAEDGSTMLVQFGPDVLISDIAMPGMDGYRFIRAIRASATVNASIPAVALTAYGGAAARDAALSAGYDHYLAKPIDARQLISVVASLASRSRT